MRFEKMVGIGIGLSLANVLVSFFASGYFFKKLQDKYPEVPRGELPQYLLDNDLADISLPMNEWGPEEYFANFVGSLSLYSVVAFALVGLLLLRGGINLISKGR